MSVFSYKAINERGENVSGTIEADSVEKAKTMLNAQGFIPDTVRKTGDVFGGNDGLPLTLKEKTTRIKAADLLIFTKQFRTLLKVGTPIVRLLQIM